MRQPITNYTFNASTKTVTFADFTAISIERVVAVKNITINLWIYKPTDTTNFPATAATNVLSFTASNAGMSNSDKLFIVYDNPATIIQPAVIMQNAVSGNANGTTLPVTGMPVALLNIVSSTPMSGGTTVNFEASVDDTTWVSIAAHAIGTNGSLVTTTTADGDFRIATAGYKSIRARISAFSAGVTTIKGYTTNESAYGTAVALATGTNEIGNVKNSGTFAVQTTPKTSGGLTTFHLVSANTTNATVIKASAGQVYGWYIFNNNASARKVAFHNTAGTPTAGASIFFTLVIPAGGGANVFTETGIAFSTGIAITTVTGIADSDNTAVATNDLTINIWYN